MTVTTTPCEECGGGPSTVQCVLDADARAAKKVIIDHERPGRPTGRFLCAVCAAQCQRAMGEQPHHHAPTWYAVALRYPNLAA